jgi:hypothetical protein
VLPLAALLAGDLPTAIAITGTYGAARALAVVATVSAAGEDFAGACDTIQTRVLTLKRVVAGLAFVTAAVLVFI